jgi:hypothetical protein
MNETLSCVTERRIAPYQESENLYKLLFRSPAPIMARNGDRFYLQVTQVCTAEKNDDGMFRAHMRQYSYVFSDSPIADYHGIVSYHWHPHDFARRNPHLHLRITQNMGYPEIERRISRAHYPTSRICLEDFVELLIEDYDIRSDLHHSTWKSILRRNKATFSKQATWFIAHPN